MEWDDPKVNFLSSKSVYFTFNILQKSNSICCSCGCSNLPKFYSISHIEVDLESQINRNGVRFTKYYGRSYRCHISCAAAWRGYRGLVLNEHLLRKWAAAVGKTVVLGDCLHSGTN